MKLNSQGWGLREMIFFSSIILIFLMIAIIFIMRLYNELGQSTDISGNNNVKIDLNYYHDIEKNVLEVTKNYVNNGNVIVSNTPQNIMFNTLVSEGYMNNAVDYVTQRICGGYSKVYLNDSDILIIDVYLNCDNYQTKGYVS